MAAYSDEQIYSAYGLLVGTTDLGIEYLKYACGLLNSKLITFYSIQKEILRKGNKATPHVGVKGLNGLPVYVDEKSIPSISSIVSKILSSKNSNSDTNALEREIDIRVYHVYNLNFEEAKLIDETLTEKEFQKFK